jgi:predicted methyltransferase
VEVASVNIIERVIDAADPVLSAGMRLLKKTLRDDTIARLIRRNVASGSPVVDVGANRGVYSWALSSRVGSSGRVHTVEPFPQNIERLRALARYRRNITVHCCLLCAGILP